VTCGAGETFNPATCECEQLGETCQNLFVCGVTLESCGQGTPTFDGLCHCVATPEGNQRCSNVFFCGLPPCQESAECEQQFGPGFFCGETCCGQTCNPPCGVDAPGFAAQEAGAKTSIGTR